MPVIDDRGRLFGKLNLIDAIVMVVALGLIPLAYGAFMLFREQPPIITSIQPTQVTQGERTTLQLIGEGFRPFLVARLGDFESSGFLVQSPTIAEVRMPELLPGSYDLALFDQAREIMRMPGAITVVPPPAPPVPVEAIQPELPPPPTLVEPPPTLVELRVAGEFIGMSRGDAERIRVGLKLEHANSVTPAVEEPRRFPVTAEVLAVGMLEVDAFRLRAGTPANMNSAAVTAPGMEEVRVPALIRVSCAIKENPAPLLGECNFGDTVLGQNATIPLTGLSTDGTDTSPTQIIFMIREVLPAVPAVSPSPPTLIELRVAGEFIGMSRGDAEHIRVGLKLEDANSVTPAVEEPRRSPATAEVLAVGMPDIKPIRLRAGTPENMNNATVTAPGMGEVRVPALIRVSCAIKENPAPLLGDCNFGDTPLGRNQMIALTEPSTDDTGTSLTQIIFMIGEVLPATVSTTSPSGQVDVEVEGEFVGLTRDDLQFVEVGSKFERWKGEPFAEVLAVGTPEPGMQYVRLGGGAFRTTAEGELAVRAIVRINCVITTSEDCLVIDTVLAQNATLLLPVPRRSDRVKFMVGEVRLADAPATSPSSRVDVQVEGEFFGLTQDDLGFVEVGSKFEQWKDEPFAEVLAVGTPEPGTQRVRIEGGAFRTTAEGELAVRAIVRINCVITTSEDCLVDDTVLKQNATVLLPVPGRFARVKFMVDAMRPGDAPAVFSSVITAIATVRVRFIAVQEVLDTMKVGDIDLSGLVTRVDEAGAVLLTIGQERQRKTSLTNTDGLLGRSVQVEESVVSFTGTVRVPVVLTQAGWSYRNQSIKVGAGFNFETISGAMRGVILDMVVSDQEGGVAR